ncbi:SycD/LcrH family type III secretion system chaperone [Ottowia sp. VDI28]|uniref:SycD/LcrH family type III secretion system chaperone n=1 Tax=Ottowia sp. VDI28 TaxID=3133968 RepID=UPI003C2D87AF
MMQFSPVNDLSGAEAMAQIGDMQEWLAAGGAVADAVNVPQAQREALYQFGYGLYTQAKYAEAFKIFALLVVYEHLNERYLMALAGAAQMLGRYEDALQHYATAAMLLMDDPRPVVHGAECLLALGQTDLARDSLNMAIELAEGAEPHSAIKVRAEALRATLNSQAAAGSQPRP